jgi:hypothetical protein
MKEPREILIDLERRTASFPKKTGGYHGTRYPKSMWGVTLERYKKYEQEGKCKLIYS